MGFIVMPIFFFFFGLGNRYRGTGERAEQVLEYESSNHIQKISSFHKNAGICDS
jgi:hypothetical protein